MQDDRRRSMLVFNFEVATRASPIVTVDPDLSVFLSIFILVRVGIVGPDLTVIFMLAARRPFSGQLRSAQSPC